MNEQKSEILVKATAQGFSIAIHGIKKEDGSWRCAFEKNEITFTELPVKDEAQSLGELRHYEKSEFEMSFEEAFRKFDNSEWFLSHPAKLHPEFTEFVLKAAEERMEDYNQQFPIDSPMEKFIRENKLKEWREKANQ